MKSKNEQVHNCLNHLTKALPKLRSIHISAKSGIEVTTRKNKM